MKDREFDSLLELRIFSELSGVRVLLLQIALLET